MAWATLTFKASFYPVTYNHISFAKKVSWPNQTSNVWASAVLPSGQERARIMMNKSNDDVYKNQDPFERLEGTYNLKRTQEGF